MDIPFELAVLALLKQGNVFYFVDPAYQSKDPHNFVLLNREPSKEKNLIFVGASSKVDSIRRLRAQEPPETLVLVNPSDYRDFTCVTLFDCNRYIERNFVEVVRLIKQEKRFKPRERIGDAILDRLIKGVLASRLVPPRIKNEIKAPSEDTV